MKTQRKLALTNLQAAQSRAAQKYLICRIELKDGKPKITDSYALSEGSGDLVLCKVNSLQEYHELVNHDPWELVQAERKRLTGQQATKAHLCMKFYVWTYEAYEAIKSLYLNTKPKTPKF